jgi:hypothetical protein
VQRPKTFKCPYGDLSILSAEDLQNASGLYNDSKATISILKDLVPEVEKRVLLHELAHHMLYWGGLRNVIGEAVEEQVCDAFSVFVINMVRKNPKLIQWIGE